MFQDPVTMLDHYPFSPPAEFTKESKKSNLHWAGRNQQNTTVVFPKENYNIGDFVNVKINSCTSATLIGEAIAFSKNN